MIIGMLDQERLEHDPEASKVVVQPIDSSHSPYLSKVEETRRWFRKSRGAEV